MSSYTVRGCTDQTQSELSSDFDGRRLLSPCQHCGVVYFTDEDLNKHIEDKHKENTEETEDDYNCEYKMASCDDCGVLFENNHDLQNHVKKWCPERLSPKRRLPDGDYTPNKRTKYDEPEGESDAESIDDEENAVFMALAEMAKESNEEEWNKKVQKYEKNGLSDDEAEEKADAKLREDDLREFMNRYAKVIRYIFTAELWTVTW